jgi:hypothetical protein
MTQLRKCFCSIVWVLFLTVLCASASGQAVPVYVSGGSNIYKISGGTASLVLTVSGANFESLAIGPDNADTDLSGNASHPVLLYACDTANNKIYRFDPATPSVTQLVYSGGPPIITPVCGRSTSTGDFYVTNKAGGGAFKLVANNMPLANAPFPTTTTTTAIATPVAVSGTTPSTPRGITQKYVGDLLVVDNAANQVLSSAYPSFSTFVHFTNSSNLGGPVGIARISTGEVFVANSVLGSGTTSLSPVVHFNRDGSAASTCSGLNFSKSTKEVPAYLATLPVANSTQTGVTDTIYLVTASKNGGTLWSWNTANGNCSLSALASIQNPLTGVAVAPAPVTLSWQVTTPDPNNPTPTTFNFNSNLFQVTGATGGCQAKVTAYPLIPATVAKMITLSASFPDGTKPAPGLGDGGYEIAYVANWLLPLVNPQCTSIFSDGLFESSVFGFYDTSLYDNPRMVECRNSDPGNEPQIVPNLVITSGSTSCAAPPLFAVYPVPFGGPIPNDQGGTVRSGNSFFAVVDEDLALTGNTTNPPGKFCGFQSPLTGDGITLPNQPAVFTGNTIAVKFKLATASGSCQNGPYISNASALISVARLTDSSGPFSAIRVNATASSLDTPPLFNAGNNQYSFSLNTGGYARGTYSLTVTFLTDNAPNQTTLFKIS